LQIYTKIHLLFLDSTKDSAQAMSEISSSDSLIAIQHLKTYIGEQIIGQDVLVERMLIALLADGHILVIQSYLARGDRFRCRLNPRVINPE
jgi:hypothetical protein